MAEFTIGDIARAKREAWLACHHELGRRIKRDFTIYANSDDGDEMRIMFLKYLKEMVSYTYGSRLCGGDDEVVKDLFDEIFVEDGENMGDEYLAYKYNIETEEIERIEDDWIDPDAACPCPPKPAHKEEESEDEDETDGWCECCWCQTELRDDDDTTFVGDECVCLDCAYAGGEGVGHRECVLKDCADGGCALCA